MQTFSILTAVVSVTENVSCSRLSTPTQTDLMKMFSKQSDYLDHQIVSGM